MGYCELSTQRGDQPMTMIEKMEGWGGDMSAALNEKG